MDIDGPMGPDYDRAYWWGPLEAVAQLIQDDPRYEDFDLDDFMVMCRYTRGNERVIEYKHIHTRRCIQLSDHRELVACDPELHAALHHLELPLGAEMKRNLGLWLAESDVEGA